MSRAEPILEQWIARTIESYPSAAVPFLSGQDDRFRNPVGYTLQTGLAALFSQLQGGMDEEQIGPALDAIIRIRAVQDLAPSQAVGFIFLLKPIIADLAPAGEREMLNNRIDRLALLAFDKYMQCREQLADIRVREGLRRIGARARSSAEGSIV
jgi:hypothetical protein